MGGKVQKPKAKTQPKAQREKQTLIAVGTYNVSYLVDGQWSEPEVRSAKNRKTLMKELSKVKDYRSGTIKVRSYSV